jgi:predicted small lipoprotein YifL
MRLCDRPFYRLALIGALVAALGLAACGRKGPLDPPPASPTVDEPRADAGVSGVDAGVSGVKDEIKPAQGPKKRLPIDVLLN